LIGIDKTQLWSIDSWICVPSKGRPNGRTFKLLKDLGIHTATVFVEPQDINLYMSLGLPVEILPDNDRGIGFARNYIVQWASKKQIKYIWMLDDDINALSFKADHDSKYYPIKTKAHLEKAMMLCKANRISMLGFIHHFNLRFGDIPKFWFKSWAVSCIILNVQDVLAAGNYTADLPLNEDAEMNLKLWLAGKRACLTSDFAYSKLQTTVGSTGNDGCSMFYQTVHKECHDYMLEKYPNWFKLRTYKKDGRLKLNASWKNLHRDLSHLGIFDWYKE